MENFTTTENPAPNLTHYAGFWRRFAALLIDGLVMAIPVYILATLFSDNPVGRINPTSTEEIEIQYFTIYNATSFLLNWLYFALFESSAKQATLGKQALGIYVCRADGQKLTFLRASLRFFGKLVSGLTMGIGYLMAAFTARKQALHDFIADSLVLKKP